ncbi:MAG TPA: hypothetical protein VLY24_18305 [Bryobacteraceae bacterium]|nr:hypothetical protein [Bryobacteraceae bacterium]
MAYVWNQRAAMAGLLLAMAFSACKSGQNVKVEEQGDESAPRIASMVHTGDPKSESQLLSGFYGIEQNAWRWTAQQFSVALRPPAGAAQKGATLNVQLAVPDVTINQLKTVTLSAGTGSVALAPETYTQSGSFTYTRDVPASQLTGDSVRLDFHLDKALPPSASDKRELGLIVSSIALDAK